MPKEIARYFIVGIVATLIDWTTVYFLDTYNFLTIYSLTLGFVHGFIINYILSYYWVFGGKNKHIQTLSKTVVVAIIGLLSSLFLVHFFIEYFGYKLMIARIITTAIVFLRNFMGRKYFAFTSDT